MYTIHFMIVLQSDVIFSAHAHFNYQEFRLPYFFILVTHVHVDQLHVKSSYVIYSCHCPLACAGEDSST